MAAGRNSAEPGRRFRAHVTIAFCKPTARIFEALSSNVAAAAELSGIEWEVSDCCGAGGYSGAGCGLFQISSRIRLRSRRGYLRMRQTLSFVSIAVVVLVIFVVVVVVVVVVVLAVVVVVVVAAVVVADPAKASEIIVEWGPTDETGRRAERHVVSAAQVAAAGPPPPRPPPC